MPGYHLIKYDDVLSLMAPFFGMVANNGDAVIVVKEMLRIATESFDDLSVDRAGGSKIPTDIASEEP